ncbi:MAG: glucosaminidase domain-containing protein [Spirochaetaceae bacterium]|jgi:hypothetical protein|nr:glucosaminidase domain-containing protein [Spirochaetaceae bacterium]
MNRVAFIYAFMLVLLFLGCSSAKKALYAEESVGSIAFASPRIPVNVPKETPKIEPPAVPLHILGKGSMDGATLARFLRNTNPLIEKKFAEDFAEIYVEEAAVEGVNHDVAFSQMCLETGFLSYGGLVTPDMNNFCGLGSTGAGVAGERFPTPRIGVRAQIQHLKVYATGAPLKRELVDPRRQYVSAGSAPTIDGLSGSWASDGEYAQKIKNILSRLYRGSF